MTIKTSSPDSTFQINTDGTWPNIVIVTDATGPHDWKWSIAWKTYNQAGTDTSPGNQWDAQQAVAGLGGTLNVTAEAGEQSASITITIKGQNPTLQQVEQYLATTNSDAFDKILNHETHMVHFNKAGEPIKSFDNGYGIAQLTSPPPTYEQVWT
ncbi:MAG TPA: hypothetical protein VGV35_07820, partial [Bryobacteraceae bacterium]|nr:hypothetical protein [Bryobacteraceae bacterium]